MLCDVGGHKHSSYANLSVDMVSLTPSKLCTQFFFSSNWNSLVQHIWSPSNEHYDHLFECLLICVWLLLFSSFYQHLLPPNMQMQFVIDFMINIFSHHTDHYNSKRLCNIGHKTTFIFVLHFSTTHHSLQHTQRISRHFWMLCLANDTKKRISSD